MAAGVYSLNVAAAAAVAFYRRAAIARPIGDSLRSHGRR